MLATSALIPPVATAWWLRGVLESRGLGPWPGRPRAVLLDRDGTLVRDVPYNRDPEAVEPMPGALEALDLLRAAGIRLGVVSNQSGVGRGLLTDSDVRAVNDRIEKVLGPFDTWAVCPHGPDEGCACRKPRPGLVLEAARRLGVEPHECVVIGDIGGDVRAARAAGARSVLVPTPETRAEELAPALCAPDLLTAARMVVGCDTPDSGDTSAGFGETTSGPGGTSDAGGRGATGADPAARARKRVLEGWNGGAR
jgi:histidinol-phosphate phosphatase family protein